MIIIGVALESHNMDDIKYLIGNWLWIAKKEEVLKGEEIMTSINIKTYTFCTYT